MFFHADLGGRDQSVSNGEQSGFTIAMPAAIDGNGLLAEVDGGEMRAAGDTGLPQRRRAKQPAEPRRMLQDGKLIPSIEGDDRLQHRRQVFGLPLDAAPFVEPGILIPVEIINERVFFGCGAGAGTAGPCGALDCRVRPRQQRIDGGIVDAGEIVRVITVVPLPSRMCRDHGPNDLGRLHRLSADQAAIGRLSQRPKTVGRKRPIRQLGGDASAGAQDVAGNGKFVGGGADIAGGVVEDEVFEMNELTVDPERGAGIGKLAAFEEAGADRRAGDALVETRQRDAGCGF